MPAVLEETLKHAWISFRISLSVIKEARIKFPMIFKQLQQRSL